METAKPGLTLFLPLESRTVVQPVRVMFSVLGTCLWGRHSLFAFDKEHRTLNTHRWHHHPDLEGQGRGQGLRLAVFKSEWCWRDHSHSCPGLSFWLNCNPHQETHFASSPSTHSHTHTHTHQRGKHFRKKYLLWLQCTPTFIILFSFIFFHNPLHGKLNSLKNTGYKSQIREFPVVQWLGLCISTAGSIPDQGTKIPQAAWCSQKKFKSNLTLAELFCN